MKVITTSKDQNVHQNEIVNLAHYHKYKLKVTLPHEKWKSDIENIMTYVLNKKVIIPKRDENEK